MATPSLRALPASAEAALVSPLRVPALLFSCTSCAFTCASVAALLEHRRTEHERWTITVAGGDA
jgi:hypothetical protein